MCVLVISAILTVASIAANKMAADKANKAREGAMTAERIRQKGFQQEAQVFNDASRDRYGGFAEQQNKKAAGLADYFQSGTNQASTVGAPEETMPGASNDIVTKEIAKQKGKADAYGAQQSAALGNLRGFGDLLGDDSRLQARDASRVGQIGGFMKGSSDVLPYELEAASHKGDNLKMWGDIMGGLGKAGMSYGLSGATSAATPTVTGSQFPNAVGPFQNTTPWRNIPVVGAR